MLIRQEQALSITATFDSGDASPLIGRQIAALKALVALHDLP